MNEAEFRAQFHSKTLSYQPRFRADQRPVVLEAGDRAHTPAGHVLILALANMLARAHGRLLFVGDIDRDLLCADPFGSTTLEEATVGVARRVNPTIDAARTTGRPAESVIHLGVGAPGAELNLGCDGWLARSGPDAPIDADGHWGAMLAACLGSWAAFSHLLGDRAILAPSYSLWNFGREGNEAGPRESALDVGRVLQVGVGGVGASLDYWLGFLDLGGEWTLVDGDEVEVSNLNRQLLFVAEDAGYPRGLSKNKAEIAAERVGFEASPRWYGADQSIVDSRPDVILALANEHGVRGALQDRLPAVLLHATTSPNNQAQFHRHISGIDDCIRCRLPGATPTLACSEVDLGPGADDAALPFLSGTAGLLLACALMRLTNGSFVEERNLQLMDFGGDSPAQQSAVMSCRKGCRTASAGVRHQVTAGTRYANLVAG
jgi:hypothetical protein